MQNMSVAPPTALDGWSAGNIAIKRNKKRLEAETASAVTAQNGPTLIGASLAMKKLFAVIDRVPPRIAQYS
jgi:DNA-binding NtrC family response regulator